VPRAAVPEFAHLRRASVGAVRRPVYLLLQHGHGLDRSTHYPIDKEQELVKAISEGDERDARRLLNEILGYIFFATGGEYQAMRVRSLELMSVLSRAAISGGADQTNVLALNRQFMEESDRLHSTDDLVGWLTRLITRYAGLVFEQADVKRKDILYDAINYMKQHLGERVTLEDTARQVGFSPNYFSKVFKDEMGCTFSYYLSKLRIDRSKALLLVSKLSIREICDAVGYEEQSYFIKVFTRFTGVTPGKFRKRGGRLDSSKERDTTAQ
jgi:two-component system response regulator YesN